MLLPLRRLLLMVCVQELFESLHTKLRAGKPGFHRASYMVQENSFFNIPASKEVRRTTTAQFP